MIKLPVLEHLDVDNYGLFPGSAEEPGLHISFLPGLTLALGSNGLGKTTLVNILYRMLTGPYDISVFMRNMPLGTDTIEVTSIHPQQKATFSQRVKDGARTASALLKFRLGEHSISIERSLKNLELISFQIDGIEQSPEERTFQKETITLVGVHSFGDWVLILRHIIFYFEDRRALVWNPAAQRQLLRVLFLPIERAQRWAQEEREILELDSSARNFRVVLNKEIKDAEDAERKAESSGVVLSQLKLLEETRDTATARRAELDEEFPDHESTRQNARLRLLSAEQERETRYRALERARLMAIEARFPDRSASARYILAQLMTSSRCLFCGNQAPNTAATLKSRISDQECLICGSHLAKVIADADSAGIADSQLADYATALEVIELELAEAKTALLEAEEERRAALQEGAELDSIIADAIASLEILARQLPPEEAERLEQRDYIARQRRRLEDKWSELEQKRDAFEEFVRGESLSLASKAQSIQDVFFRYARGFLFNDCFLTYSPRRERLGQSGGAIEFPAFEVKLGGTDFPSPLVRSGPDRVSESQREFIDLAFRMALMKTASTDGIGSLVIDAPESSLDTVFSKRAAEVLELFAQPEENNRLFVTSNLNDSTLLPRLVELVTDDERRDTEHRIANLFDIAVPTTAFRENEGEYRDAIAKLYSPSATNLQDE